MLVRLQDALDRSDLSEKMVLLPGSCATDSAGTKSKAEINLVVGYNSSPSSQTALDLTLWIAHQTRLVTQKPVTVEVVYVVDYNKTELFEQSGRIFQQARYLADEWGGNLKTHLCYGSVSTELRKVVEVKAAALLFLGCSAINHPVVQKLGDDFPCPVLGIPNTLLEKQTTERTRELSA
jgi:hypothetical protein